MSFGRSPTSHLRVEDLFEPFCFFLAAIWEMGVPSFGLVAAWPGTPAVHVVSSHTVRDVIKASPF